MSEEQRNSCISVRAIGTRIINPCQENRAFDGWDIPVLTRQIRHTDPFFRKRALKTLLDTLYDPCKLATSDFQSIISPMKSLSNDSDVGVRQLLTECLAVISMSAVGRKILIDSGLYENLTALLQDTSPDIRKIANITLRRTTLFPTNVAKLEMFIPTLLVRLPQEEDDDTKVVILTTLHVICSSSLKTDHLLGTSKMLVSLLENPCPEVRQGVCSILMDSCMIERGKLDAIDEGAVPLLLELCRDTNPAVVAKALSPLMMIVTCTPGKEACTGRHDLSFLITLLRREHVETKLNCICMLTALIENSTALKAIAPHAGIFHGLLKDPAEEVKNASKTILRVLERRLR